MKKPTVTLIHEQIQGKHRIVRVSSNGTNETGSWVHDTELAQLGNLRAGTGCIEGLPCQQIFTTPVKETQVLE